jgi:hypothetical protein
MGGIVWTKPLAIGGAVLEKETPQPQPGTTDPGPPPEPGGDDNGDSDEESQDDEQQGG